MRHENKIIVLLLALWLVVFSTVQSQDAEFREGELIVKFKSQVSQQSYDSTLARVGIQIVKRFDEIGALKCSIPADKTVAEAIAACSAETTIEYAEPNYIYRASREPNDQRFSQLWGMAMIDAPEAWDVQTGSRSVIVGVIDTGTDHGHEDLRNNIWSNPGESGGGRENNGADDDGNGFVDDFRGWDFVNNDNNPFDDNDHGTHVSGTVGAVGNNSIGVVGVNWTVSIMPLKFLAADGSGSTDDAIDAIVYGTRMGAKILNNSWGGGGRSQALQDAIEFANDNGVLFVAAAGNDAANNDNVPTFPANYEVANVISVAASTESDNMAGFSNFGKETVHLAAPGNNIVSTVANSRYNSFSGTSMATPHVAGAAGLVLAQYPGLTMNQLKIRILGSIERNTNFSDRVITGGRLNVNRAISTNPIIANTTRLESTPDETGPYIVDADILDDTGIQSATLTFQVGGEAPVEVAMTETSSDHYQGQIPGQPGGSSIVYFVKAVDDSGNETRDSNFSFAIAEPDDEGCGSSLLSLRIGNDGLNSVVNPLFNISFFILLFFLLKYFPRSFRYDSNY